MPSVSLMHNLNMACGSPLGFCTLPDESYVSSRTLFRWILVDWIPAQPTGLRLPKVFKIPSYAQLDFSFEQEQLLRILDTAWNVGSSADWDPQCILGRMTPAEWRKLFQIHVDYHLKQFAA